MSDRKEQGAGDNVTQMPSRIMKEVEAAHFDVLRREALSWVLRVTSGEATADDGLALEDWRGRSPAHAQALREAIRLRRTVKAVGRLDAPPIASPGPRQRAPSRRALLAGGAMAAGVAGVMIVRPPFGLWPSAGDIAADLRSDARTATGQQLLVTPATGVSVTMNTQTNLVFGRGAASLELIRGEALISVARPNDGDLVLVAGHGRVTGASATFNVRHDSAAVTLTCVEGAVRLECAGRTVSLTARQQVVYGSQGAQSVVTAEPEQVTAWREGLLIFRNAPLDAVVAEINRYRPGRIILARRALARTPVYGVFHLQRIAEAPADIQRLTGAELTVLPGGLAVLT